MNHQAWSFLLHDLSSLEPTQSRRAGEGTSEALGFMIEASSHNDEETLVWERLKALDFPENRWDYIFVKVGRSLSLYMYQRYIYKYISYHLSIYTFIYHISMKKYNLPEVLDWRVCPGFLPSSVGIRHGTVFFGARPGATNWVGPSRTVISHPFIC